MSRSNNICKAILDLLLFAICSIAASLDLDVADGELGAVAGALAPIVPQPGSIATPVRDHEAHSLGQV